MEDEAEAKTEGRIEGPIDGKADPKEEESKKKKKEPSCFSLENPSRVTPEQEAFVSFDLNQRYHPVNPRSKPAGIVILVDRSPSEPEEVETIDLPASDATADEASPPEPFEWSP